MSTQGSSDGFTVKEIVIEISRDVKELSAKVDRIDQSAAASRDQLVDHTRDLADHEKRISLIEQRPPVTRTDIHDLKGEIASIKLWQAGLTAVATWKKWQVSAALAFGGLASGMVGAVATILWLNH